MESINEAPPNWLNPIGPEATNTWCRSTSAHLPMPGYADKSPDRAAMTNFHEGDDLKVTLRNSNWPQFDSPTPRRSRRTTPSGALAATSGAASLPALEKARDGSETEAVLD